MDIGRIAEQSAQISATTPKPAAQETEKKTTTLASDNTDKFVESETTFTPAYTKKSAGKSHTNTASDNEAATVKVQKPQSFIQMKNSAFKAMVSDTIGKQSGLAWNAIMADKTKMDDADYWGADATAQRIFDFAKNLAGDDDEMFQTLKDAVEEGFSQASKSFSKKTGQNGLPSVCNDTYDKVMGMFDNWEKEIAASKETSATTDKSTSKTEE